MPEAIEIRREEPRDRASVREVNLKSFEQEAEGKLVDLLRDRNAITLSLVAVTNGRVVGHILFSPVEFRTACGAVQATGLGPMAVLPDHQRCGVGSRLVERGLQVLRGEGHQAVIVLGHPEYYPRFGFVPASRFGIRSTYDVPDNVFMALELQPGSLQNCAGTVHYQPEFDAV